MFNRILKSSSSDKDRQTSLSTERTAAGSGNITGRKEEAKEAKSTATSMEVIVKRKSSERLMTSSTTIESPRREKVSVYNVCEGHS